MTKGRNIVKEDLTDIVIRDGESLLDSPEPVRFLDLPEGAVFRYRGERFEKIQPRIRVDELYPCWNARRLVDDRLLFIGNEEMVRCPYKGIIRIPAPYGNPTVSFEDLREGDTFYVAFEGLERYRRIHDMESGLEHIPCWNAERVRDGMMYFFRSTTPVTRSSDLTEEFVFTEGTKAIYHFAFAMNELSEQARLTLAAVFSDVLEKYVDMLALVKTWLNTE
jgi:hypothetical protein